LAETARDLESRLRVTEAELAKCQGEVSMLRSLKKPSRGVNLPAERANEGIGSHFEKTLRELERNIIQKDNELRGTLSSGGEPENDAARATEGSTPDALQESVRKVPAEDVLDDDMRMIIRGRSWSGDDDKTWEEEERIMSQTNPANDAMISCGLVMELLTSSIDHRDLIHNGYACYDADQINPCLTLGPLDAWTNAVIHLIQDQCGG